MRVRTNRNKNRDILDLLCRHLVVLTAKVSPKRGQQIGELPKFVAYAGVLMELQNQFYYLTAGHILSELKEAIESDAFLLQEMALMDGFGYGAIDSHAIPFQLETNKIFAVDDDSAGLDFGVIALDNCYVRLLLANGIIPLRRQDWINQESIGFEEFFMLGIPEELTSVRVALNDAATVSPTYIRITRLDELPEDIPNPQFPPFMGELPDNLPLKSLVGMSGGPIFGFRLTPDVRYWIVALQSKWHSSHRIVLGTSVPLLAELMNDWANSTAA